MVNEILYDVYRYEENKLKTRNRLIEAIWELAEAEKEKIGRACTQCGKEIDPVKDGIVMCRDNFIQAKYFQEMNRSNNIFCSQDCACQYLSIKRVYQTEDGELIRIQIKKTPEGSSLPGSMMLY